LIRSPAFPAKFCQLAQVNLGFRPLGRALPDNGDWFEYYPVTHPIKNGDPDTGSPFLILNLNLNLNLTLAHIVEETQINPGVSNQYGITKKLGLLVVRFAKHY